MTDSATLSPTSGQSAMLAFFGLTARSKAEASQVLGKALELPMNQRRWICERARRLVATMRPAVSGGGGHDATFAVACALVHGFDLTINEAMDVMQDYNRRCEPPWSDSELFHKLQTAETWGKHDKPRGHLIGDRGGAGRADAAAGAAARKAYVPQAPVPQAKQRVDFNPAKLRELAGQWRDAVNLIWLANRSAVDPATVSPEGFLQLLYQRVESVWTGETDWGRNEALWPAMKPSAGSVDGVKFLAQPLDGRLHLNRRKQVSADKIMAGKKYQVHVVGDTDWKVLGAVRGVAGEVFTAKLDRRGEGRGTGTAMTYSRRIAEAVTSFRYIVLESDSADLQDWIGLLVQLPLRIEALYMSGGKSVHALIRVDQPTANTWDFYKENTLAPTINLLCLGGLDPKVLSAVRLTRLPNTWRGEKLQKLLYVRPAAPVQALTEVPAVRDVVEQWCGIAALGPSDADETGEGVRAVRAALEFYGPANKRCREELINFNRLCAEAGFDCGK
ncbi:MAG: hypothetical protein Q8M02_10535 [Candidatus Didemnitutus sp.]|nr:hypothetical protein [Candidatus Didemnitutus sp.]